MDDDANDHTNTHPAHSQRHALPTIPTLTSLPTLNSDQAKETIQALLREPVDCPAPCFWGITPNKTTLEEAKQNLAHLGIRPQYTNTLDNKEYYDTSYTFDYGLSISPLLETQDGVIQNLVVNITPELQQPGVPRGWLVYSPETLITKYGLPSRVDFFLGRREPPRYSMQMYFEAVDLIIQFGSFDITFVPDGIRVCPLLDQYDSIRIWFGANPEHPPGAAVHLEEGSTLTMEEFSSLMTKEPDNACFNLKAEAFP